ncbi:MAG: hypothetical protein NWF07_08260 [Candidatus Bathyarchaeota archaeon]|nr:hypothetical protein [Candidatus Bathyarchaeota archaeon]
MKKTNILQIVVSILMLVALLYGRPVNYPDNVNNQHGFPLVWGTHQLVTIAGPVDYWMVSLTSLAVDIILWIALIFVIPLIVDNTDS